jgi:2-polyprenyl-3-methyl-5-hydroxy-6-metoxy-1,4-benzoquinol methylase
MSASIIKGKNSNESYFFTRLACPVCSSNHLRQLCDVPYIQGELQAYLRQAYGEIIDFSCLQNSSYSLMQCQECSLFFQKTVPTPKLMDILYNEWISSGQVSPPKQNLDYYSLYAQDILQVFAFLRKPPATLEVFDFGMGWGRWLLMAKAFGCNVYGSDLSEQRLHHARSNSITPLTWDEIPAYQFDFINSDQVFEHLEDPKGTLAHLAKALKPGGIIKICVPNSSGIRYRLHQMDWAAPKGSLRSLNPVAPLEHINCFTRKAMLKLAEDALLQEVKIPLKIQYQYVTTWNSSKRIARNLIMPLYRNVLGLQNYYLFQKV